MWWKGLANEVVHSGATEIRGILMAYQEACCRCGSEEFYLVFQEAQWSRIENTILEEVVLQCAGCGWYLKKRTTREYSRIYLCGVEGAEREDSLRKGGVVHSPPNLAPDDAVRYIADALGD